MDFRFTRVAPAGRTPPDARKKVGVSSAPGQYLERRRCPSMSVGVCRRSCENPHQNMISGRNGLWNCLPPYDSDRNRKVPVFFYPENASRQKRRVLFLACARNNPIFHWKSKRKSGAFMLAHAFGIESAGEDDEEIRKPSTKHHFRTKWAMELFASL